MPAFGAELTVVPSEGPHHEEADPGHDRGRARAGREPHTYWTDQLNNHDSIAGYLPMGEEIWAQTGGKVDAFVHAVGTAASLRGVATVLKRHKPMCGSSPSNRRNPRCSRAAARAAQDRRHRHRLHAAALGARPGG